VQEKNGTTVKPKTPLRDAWMAAKTNLGPAIVLQLLAVAILVGYYNSPTFKARLEILGQLKTEWGLNFSFISTALTGGLLPFVFLRMQKSTQARAPYRHLPFFLLLWGLKGIEVDFLYRFQAFLFGTGTHWTVLVPKILFDQLIYLTVWGMPTIVLAFAWKESGFRISEVVKLFNRRFFVDKVFPLIIPNWFVWIPAVAIIYSLPLPLQLPIQNLVLCMWVLILTLLAPSVSTGK